MGEIAQMATTKADLADWVYDALVALGGKSRIAPVARHIWQNHEPDLRSSDDLFYTWQYDMRWAAQHLRDKGKCKRSSDTPRGVWEISGPIN